MHEPSAATNDASAHIHTDEGLEAATATPSSGRATPRMSCVWHCQSCQQHFHSLGSFDAHLSDNGDFTECCEGAAAIIIGRDKKIRPALQAWTEDGWCELAPGCYVDGVRVNWVHPVVVWQQAVTEEQRERLQALSGRKGQESEGLSDEQVVGGGNG